jgi:hypothetical protein
MTSTTKLMIRVWLTLTSAGAFLSGWGVLAHAPKAEASSASAPPGEEIAAASGQTPTQPIQLAPVPSLEQLRQGAGFSSAPAPAFRFSTRQAAPSLRTRGS